MDYRLGIVIVVYNTAALIVKQVECIKKYCKDEYDIIIIDNSTDKAATDAIRYYNRELKCYYYKTNAATVNGSNSHAFACNFSYNRLKDSYKYFLYLDHDNFPVKDFSVSKILKGKIMGGLAQGANEKSYFWAGCVMFNNSKIESNFIDFSTNNQYRLDTGGNLYKIIDKYGRDNCVFFSEAYYQNAHFSGTAYNFYSMIYDETFMHFINSSNWAKATNNQERINSLLNILETKIK